MDCLHICISVATLIHMLPISHLKTSHHNFPSLPTLLSACPGSHSGYAWDHFIESIVELHHNTKLGITLKIDILSQLQMNMLLQCGLANWCKNRKYIGSWTVSKAKSAKRIGISTHPHTLNIASFPCKSWTFNAVPNALMLPQVGRRV